MRFAPPDDIDEDLRMIDFEQKIRERAYQIWEQEGRVHGRAEQHWLKAQFELTAAEDMAPSAAAPAKKARRAPAAKAAPVAAPAKKGRRTPATLQ
jgi:Protein of unknown function (DUF2934)